MKLYGMGAIGALIGMVGDGLCLLAGLAYLHGMRGIAYALGAVAMAVWSASAVVWVAMIVHTNGSFARPAMAWAVSGAGCSIALTVARGERQSVVEWVCFVVMFAASAARGIWG